MKKIGYTGTRQDLRGERTSKVKKMLAAFANDLEVANDIELMNLESVLTAATVEYLRAVRAAK